MTNAIFITPEDVVANYPMFNGNIDVNTMKAAIISAQEDYIYDVLGTNLYNEIQNQIATSGAPQGNYATLVDNYVASALICWVAYDCFVSMATVISNKGVQENNSDYSSPASLEKIQMQRDAVSKKAGKKTQRISDYLYQYNHLFPELNTNNGVDEKNPTGGGYISPIFNPRKSRGTCGCKCKDECTHRIW